MTQLRREVDHYPKIQKKICPIIPQWAEISALGLTFSLAVELLHRYPIVLYHLDTFGYAKVKDLLLKERWKKERDRGIIVLT